MPEQDAQTAQDAVLAALIATANMVTEHTTIGPPNTPSSAYIQSLAQATREFADAARAIADARKRAL